MNVRRFQVRRQSRRRIPVFRYNAANLLGCPGLIVNVYSVDKLMTEARRLAAEYRRATGKTLPVSGELAIHDAIMLLGMRPAPEDASGYDAVCQLAEGEHRIQLKGRAIFDETKRGHRVGQLHIDRDWDELMLVLMDEHYEPTEIYTADREVIMDALTQTRDSKRGRRGAISVARFRIIGELLWTKDRGRLDLADQA